MAFGRLLLNDETSNLLLVDDESVLLLNSQDLVGPDTSPYRRFYRLDGTTTHEIDSRRQYHLDARRTYRSR